MNRQEREQLEIARQKGIRRYNEQTAEQAFYELSRVSCGAGCEVCHAPDCPHARQVDVEIPQ